MARIPSLFVALLSLCLVAAPAVAQAPTTAFDGTWIVIVSCSAASDGALGYVYRFPASVSDGVLHGEHKAKGLPGWLTIDGTIKSDGSAILLAQGLTGRSAYSVDRVQPLTAYAYHVVAHFGPTQGTGTRMELRPCDLQFSKSS
jgi:hypothetical protein